MNEALGKSWLKRRPRTFEPNGNVSVVDLFAGCGGLSLGLAAAAARRSATTSGLAVEMNPAIASVHHRNFPSLETIAASVESVVDGRVGDQLTPSELRLRRAFGGSAFLVGGPPCQGHSDLNNHTRRSDPRNALYLRMARAAEVLQPVHVIIENVPSVRHDSAGVVEASRRILEGLGYAVDDSVVSMVQLGVPQRRRRHLLVATLSGHQPRQLFEALARSRVQERSVRWAIEDLVDVDRGPLDQASTRSAANIERMNHLFDNDEHDLPDRLRPPCHRDKPHSYNAVYGRLHWDEPAPTITTGFTSMGQGRYVHPSRRRTLTPHEAARLQGFPDWFDWGDSRRTVLSTMIGNAVPPALMYTLAGMLMDPAEAPSEK